MYLYIAITINKITIHQNHHLVSLPEKSTYLIGCGLDTISVDSIHLVGCGLDTISVDSIHLVGCGLNQTVNVDSIHLVGCGLNAVSAEPIHHIGCGINKIGICVYYSFIIDVFVYHTVIDKLKFCISSRFNYLSLTVSTGCYAQKN